MKLEKLTPNFHKVDFGGTKIIYFSYETPIAFYDGLRKHPLLHNNGIPYTAWIACWENNFWSHQKGYWFSSYCTTLYK